MFNDGLIFLSSIHAGGIFKSGSGKSIKKDTRFIFFEKICVMLCKSFC